jgi:hypothetical protein
LPFNALIIGVKRLLIHTQAFPLAWGSGNPFGRMISTHFPTLVKKFGKLVGFIESNMDIRIIAKLEQMEELGNFNKQVISPKPA